MISPYYLQAFCNQPLLQPTVSLPAFKGVVCLLAELILRRSIPAENILVQDLMLEQLQSSPALEREQFLQREEAQFHVSTNFENAIFNAVEAGNREVLDRHLGTPFKGQVGRMSTNELRKINIQQSAWPPWSPAPQSGAGSPPRPPLP